MKFYTYKRAGGGGGGEFRNAEGVGDTNSFEVVLTYGSLTF